MPLPRPAVAACLLLLLPADLRSQPSAEGSLGTVHFATSCAASERAAFDRAVALLHHMTYPAAREAFRSIGERDPGCAMAHWGVAMTRFQPLWPTRPTVEDLRLGREAVDRARSIGAATERERQFIAAAGAFFDDPDAEYWERIGRWAEAMARIHEAFPADPEAAAFFALSHLATAPASGGVTHHATAAATLGRILAAEPTHPGAIHYMIHANDAAGREHESLDVVRRYDTVAPRNPHALHMPTHIFARLGDWRGVIAGNLRAAEAALANPAGDRKQWVWDEYPHAVEYLVYAYLQTADDAAALEALTTLKRTGDLEPTFKTAFHLASIPARYALERHDWAGAARLEPRPSPALAWDRFPWPEAVTWFARGIGSARSGDPAAARTAEAHIEELRTASERLGEALFARQTEILRLGVAAWRARAEDRNDEAIGLMEEAVRLESSTPKPPVTPAPTLPAAELLGDLLMELGSAGAALEAYERSLTTEPGRFNSLAGAARAAAATGDSTRAAGYYQRLLDGAATGSTRPDLEHAAAFLRRPRSDGP